jgi:hypothetical protein
MSWTQIYNPLGSLPLSALVASLPVVVLLGLLAFFHVKAHIAAIAGLITSLAVAMTIYGMPGSLAIASAANGAAFGLFPIGWIVLCAIFVYDITVETGKFEIVKETIARLASDRRIQALLIAYSFGAFIEGAAGFGTPVAISAAMLIGLGFKPLEAAGHCAHRQHRSGGLWRAGHSYHRAGQSDRIAAGNLERDGWPATPDFLRNCAVLAGMGDGRVQGDARSVARVPGFGTKLCHRAVSDQ